MASVMQELRCDMNAEIEEILRQLHELRKYMGPVELLLVNMETQITKNRVELERRIAALESRIDELLSRTEPNSAELPAPAPSATRAAPGGPPPAAAV